MPAHPLPRLPPAVRFGLIRNREGSMAEEKLVTYSCDGCLREMARRELRRFVLEERKMDNSLVASAKFELCTDCEGKLHETAFPLMPAKQRERLEGIIR